MQTKDKPLTPREKEVLQDLAADLTTKDIADKYGVSMGTVATYRHSILRKAGCRTSSGAVAKLWCTTHNIMVPCGNLYAEKIIRNNP